MLQLFSLACLLGGLAGLTMASKAPVLDADVWWHLKVGDWIVEHHAFPHFGLFSRTAATRPWMAYSWGYEVLLSRAYAWFGLIGLALFGILMTAAVAGTYFWMLHRLSGRFWLSWVLCLAGSLSFLFNVLPRPVFFSMMFFAVVLLLLLEADRSGRAQKLYWLPLVFVFWVNFHIQFIYGLIVVGIYVVTNLLQPAVARTSLAKRFADEPTFPPGVLFGVLAACVLACCLGPYSYHLFEVALSYSNAKFPYIVLDELKPPDFRHPSDYFLVLLAVAAFVAVFRRKDSSLFQLALLCVASVFAFRAVRDAWLLAMPAAAFLAVPASERERAPALRWYEMASVCMTIALLLFLVARNTGFNTRELDRTISAEYPVNAVNFIRRNPFPGPLYNDFGWGGFLIWYMPNYPVAIDGRTDLYGDELDFMTWKGISGDYASDRFLQEAGVVLIPKETPLARVLATDPQFRLVYSDRLAVVFVRK